MLSVGWMAATVGAVVAVVTPAARATVSLSVVAAEMHAKCSSEGCFLLGRPANDVATLVILLVAAIVPHLALGAYARVKAGTMGHEWYDAARNTAGKHLPSTGKVVRVLGVNAALHVAALWLALPWLGLESEERGRVGPGPGTWTDAARLWVVRTLAVLFHMTVFDVVFYWGHRALHATAWAFWFHDLHHSIKADRAWNAWYMNPVDSFLENTLPGLAGPVLWRLLVGSHGAGVDVVAVAAWFFYQELDNVKVHVGCDLGFLESGYHHYVHHQSHKCNYSNEWIDKLFGTYRETHVYVPKRKGKAEVVAGGVAKEE